MDSKIIANLVAGLELTIENAKSLFNEAEILKAHGAIHRAVFLHQISMEECAKVEMISSVLLEYIVNAKIDLETLKRRVSSHENKNRANAYYFSDKDEDVLDHAAFKRFQKKFHTISNNTKNNSLYVNIENQSFSLPEKRNMEQYLEALVQKNKDILRIATTHMELSKKAQREPEKTKNEYIINRKFLLDSLNKAASPQEALKDFIGKIKDLGFE
jgi:AbiV family abortive infection protein